MTSSLSINVFNSGYKPVPGAPRWDGKTPTTWPASTSTLISGDREALLVDALLTVAEGERLAEWVNGSGKQPGAILVTHGHADHFFGAGPVLDAVAGAELIASDPQVVDEAQAQTSPEQMQTWTAWFPGQVSLSPVVPTLVESPEFDIDGHPVMFRTVGGADGALGTIVHVPEEDTICAGDAVYNNIHMWLWNSTQASRRLWLESLNQIAALQPATIITGHKDPDAPDDDADRVLGQSRRYIEIFDQAVAENGTPDEVVDAMLVWYPDYGNLSTLLASAYSQFPS
jgi:glyoxylase-like metal-dependent hydrolase (beta-lactamase superfamily II)